MILLLIIFLSLIFILALIRPTYLIILYLVISTNFFGFVSIQKYFVFNGLDIGMPMVNMMVFISLIFILKWQRSPPKKYLYFIVMFMLFILYGIGYPVIMGYESIFQSLIASKEYLTVSLLLYLVMYRRHIDKELIIKAISFIGIYLSLVYIFYFIFKVSPPFYAEEDRVSTSFPTYISLALILYYVKFINKEIKYHSFAIVFVILTSGILLSNRISLVVGMGLTLSILYLFYYKGRFNLKKLLLKFSIFFVAIFSVILVFDDIRDSIVTEVDMIYLGTNLAIASRDKYNQGRWDAVAEAPLLGYGFIHKSAPITSKFVLIESHRFNERFEVVDSGYLNLVISFGYIGAVLYLLMWASIVFPPILNPNRYQVMQVGMSIYLLQYFFINYTWSVYTYSFGLIPGFLAIFFLLHSRHRS